MNRAWCMKFVCTGNYAHSGHCHFSWSFLFAGRFSTERHGRFVCHTLLQCEHSTQPSLFVPTSLWRNAQHFFSAIKRVTIGFSSQSVHTHARFGSSSSGVFRQCMCTDFSHFEQRSSLFKPSLKTSTRSHSSHGSAHVGQNQLCVMGTVSGLPGRHPMCHESTHPSQRSITCFDFDLDSLLT